jgi:hypothetical protein
VFFIDWKIRGGEPAGVRRRSRFTRLYAAVNRYESKGFPNFALQN